MSSTSLTSDDAENTIRRTSYKKNLPKHLWGEIMATYNIKTARTFTVIRQYAFLFTLTVAIGGLYYPKLGLSVIPVMIGLLLFSFFKGRYWCGNICAHGSLFDFARHENPSVADRTSKWERFEDRTILGAASCGGTGLLSWTSLPPRASDRPKPNARLWGYAELYVGR